MVGVVVLVSFCSGFEIWIVWIRVPPSWVSPGVAPVGAIVSCSTRNFLHPGPESEPVLNECDAEPSSTSVLGSVGCVQQESQQETDKLEGYRDEHVPQEGEERSSREPLYNHFSRDGGGGNTGREVNGGSFPIWGDGISLCGGVGWWCILLGFLGRQVDAIVTV